MIACIIHKDTKTQRECKHTYTNECIGCGHAKGYVELLFSEKLRLPEEQAKQLESKRSFKLNKQK